VVEAIALVMNLMRETAMSPYCSRRLDNQAHNLQEVVEEQTGKRDKKDKGELPRGMCVVSNGSK